MPGAAARALVTAGALIAVGLLVGVGLLVVAGPLVAAGGGEGPAQVGALRGVRRGPAPPTGPGTSPTQRSVGVKKTVRVSSG